MNVCLFLVLDVQLLEPNSNSSTQEKTEKKKEFHGTSFHNWANFNNFCGI